MYELIFSGQALHLVSALVIGGLIGAERSFSGRPAGFRTHVLVCVSSSLLMMISVYQAEWLGDLPVDMVRTDPTRMAQGIMTGIGFLGAGVIFKEGLTVRGLTTAASIWMTAAIGALLGIGFYGPALLASALTLLTLSVLRMLEDWIPRRHHAEHVLRFHRETVLPEQQVRDLLRQVGCRVLKVGYRLSTGGEFFEYTMVIRAMDRRSFQRLSRELLRKQEVVGFRLSPMVD
ncbi:MgtC/SapB family protein [Alkalilimnicola sp. S0819]|uniref:MgtC/SapB family protein n=1 Tax=Alkalilimnicola sp. S0819 TaxID=2613922 RepID=UPI001D00F51B|nr:MgtC/SapB family protein [Alkalilimnicola sp. S0819]